MFLRVVHIALVAALLNCPYCCHVSCGGEASGAESGQTPPCCEACRSDQPADHSGSNRPAPDPCDSPCKACQCICGGAIVDASKSAEVTQHGFCPTWPLVASVVDLAAVALERPPDGPPDRLIPATPGRLICLRNMTLLC